MNRMWKLAALLGLNVVMALMSAPRKAEALVCNGCWIWYGSSCSYGNTAVHAFEEDQPLCEDHNPYTGPFYSGTFDGDHVNLGPNNCWGGGWDAHNSC